MPKKDEPLEISPEEWSKLKDQSGGLLHDPKEPEQEAETNVEQPSVEPPKTYEGQAADGKSGLFGELHPGPAEWLTGPGATIEITPLKKMPGLVFDQAATDAPPDTGHYDDGHAFGWTKKSASKDDESAEGDDDDEPDEDYDTSIDDGKIPGDARAGMLFGPMTPTPIDPGPVAPAKATPKEADIFDPSKAGDDASSGTLDPDIDTGHYDDGHAFGWKTKGASGGTSSAPPTEIQLSPFANVPVLGLVPAHWLLSPLFLVVVGVLSVLAVALIFGRLSASPEITPLPTIAAATPSAPFAATPAATAGAAAAPVAAAQGYRCEGPQIELFNNWKTDATLNGGTPPSFSTAGKTYCLVFVATYHWNGGKGASPGSVELAGGAGTVSGQVTAGSGQGGAPQVDWVYTPAAELRPLLSGSYTCRDSDPATWSGSEQSAKQGFCKVVVQAAVK